MKVYNYLCNLPRKNYNIKKLSEKTYREYLIDGLHQAEYNTDDPDLQNFKDCLTTIMINKIYKGYDLENYFAIRNILIQIPESIIKSLKDELIDLLNKTDNEIIEETEKLTTIHEFTFLDERIKTDKGYEIRKRKINVSDIYQAIMELDKKINVYICNYVDAISSNEITSNEMELLIKVLDSDNNQELFQKFEEKFGHLKNCQIKIIEKLYQYEYQELNIRLKQKLKRKINLCGIQQRKDEIHEIMDYRSTLASKGVFDKRSKIKVMG